MKDSVGNLVNVSLKKELVLAPMHSVVADSYECVRIGLGMLESTDSPRDIAEVAPEKVNFDFRIQSFNRVASLDSTQKKLEFERWILRKGFEDLIKGATLTLVEAFVYCNLRAAFSTYNSIEALSADSDKFRRRALKAHLPTLFDWVRKFLTSDLNYRDQILSINDARACLVHRNGFVTDLDLNDESAQQLVIECMRFRLFHVNENEKIEVEMGKPVSAGSGIYLDAVPDTFRFDLNRPLELTFKQYQAAIQTCQFFGLDLLDKLPN